MTVRRISLDGKVLAEAKLTVDAGPRANSAVALPPEVSTAGDPEAELLVAQAGGAKAFWFFAEDRDMSYPTASFDAQADPVHGGLRVTVTARTILRDLCLFPDRLDPASTVDNALVTLLPGESTSFFVRTDRSLDPAALTCQPVLRCINDFL